VKRLIQPLFSLSRVSTTVPLAAKAVNPFPLPFPSFSSSPCRFFSTSSSPFANCPPPSSSSTASPASPPLPPKLFHLPDPSKLKENIQHCISLVKQHSNNHYLAYILLPQPAQSHLFILRAFLIELSLIAYPSPTSSLTFASSSASPSASLLPTTASARQLKLNWWSLMTRSLISSPLSPPPAHPVLQCLHFLIHSRSLSPLWIHRLLDAFGHLSTALSDPIHPPPPSFSSASSDPQLRSSAAIDYAVANLPVRDINQWDAFAESTESTFLYLALQSVGEKNLQADHVASHIGKAVATQQRLRNLPLLSAERRCLLPASIVASSQIDLEQVFRVGNTDQLREAVFQLASTAKAHLHHARLHIADISQDSRRLMLPAIIADRWLDELERCEFNVFDPKAFEMEKHSLEPLKLRWALWYNAKKCTY